MNGFFVPPDMDPQDNDLNFNEMVKEYEADLRGMANEYELQIQDLQEEIGDLEDDNEDLYEENSGLKAELKASVLLPCPICYGPIIQDVIDGLICRECRRVYELKEKQ